MFLYGILYPCWAWKTDAVNIFPFINVQHCWIEQCYTNVIHVVVMILGAGCWMTWWMMLDSFEQNLIPQHVEFNNVIHVWSPLEWCWMSWRLDGFKRIWFHNMLKSTMLCMFGHPWIDVGYYSGWCWTALIERNSIPQHVELKNVNVKQCRLSGAL